LRKNPPSEGNTQTRQKNTYERKKVQTTQVQVLVAKWMGFDEISLQIRAILIHSYLSLLGQNLGFNHCNRLRLIARRLLPMVNAKDNEALST
jgi:hypothetical protein